MKTIEQGIQTFASAAARATAHLLHCLSEEDQERIAHATERGARLEMVHFFSANETGVRLDLVDAAGARHTVASMQGRIPTMQ